MTAFRSIEDGFRVITFFGLDRITYRTTKFERRRWLVLIKGSVGLARKRLKNSR